MGRIYIHFENFFYANPDFWKWAFGESVNIGDKRGLFLRKQWNSIHGDKLYLEINGIIEKDLKKMIKLWEKEKLLSHD